MSLTIESVPITSIHEDTENARAHDARNLAAIHRSILRHEQVLPLVVRRANRRIIGGNATYRVLKDLGRSHVDVVLLDVDETTAKELAIRLNRTAELAAWDIARLESLLDELEDVGIDPASLDFLLEDLQDLGIRKAPGILEDEAPQPPDDPVTRPGDLWAFPTGHRVLCGDATKPDAVQRLFGDEKSALVFTDPPYGIRYLADDETTRHRPIANDDLTGDDLVAFLTAALRNTERHAAARAPFYVWHATSTRRDFERALFLTGLEERAYIIWAKPNHVLGRGDYQQQHEPCFYAARSAERPAWTGDRGQSTVWTVHATGDARLAATLRGGIVLHDGNGHELYLAPSAPKRKIRRLRLTQGQTVHVLLSDDVATDTWTVGRDTTHAIHPTQKPVELAARAIRNHTSPGEIVHDAFLGSGSTLSAAEQLGRRCYGTELDPAYCDAILQRYVALTGKRPVRDGDGFTWPRSNP